MGYEETKQWVIDELLRSAAAHEAKDIWKIDGSCDELEFRIANEDAPEFEKLRIALEFWSGWIDARNHDWSYYKGIGATDWPRLARQLAADLAADRYTEDERFREHFDPRYRVEKPSLWRRLKQRLSPDD
jgi:hypothetical protein